MKLPRVPIPDIRILPRVPHLPEILHNKYVILGAIAGFTALLGLVSLKVDPLFIVAGLVGIAVGAVLISYPFACVPIYYVLLYTRPGDVFPQLEKLRLILVIVFVMAASFLLRVLVFRTLRVLRNPQIIFVLGLLAAIALSIFDSYYRSISLERFFDMTRILVMVILVAHIVNSHRKLKVMTWTILLSLSLLATINFVQWALGTKVVDNGGSGGMSGGFLGDGNDFALALNVMMPLAVFQFLWTKKFWVKIACAGVTLSFVASVIATYSRGGFLGAITVFLLAGYFNLKRSGKWIQGVFTTLIVFLVAFVAVAALAPDSFKDRITGMSDYQEDESALGRLDAWGAGMRMLRDQPLFGVGAGAFSVAYGTRYKPIDAVAANWREAHSLYVQSSAELGLFGIFFIAGLIFLMFRDQKKIHSYSAPDPQMQFEIHYFADALKTGMIAYLVSGAFLSVIYYPHLYILSTITMILFRIAKDSSQLLPTEVADED